MTDKQGKTIEADDLTLVDSMADAGKTDEELWQEISAAETGEPAEKENGQASDDFPANEASQAGEDGADKGEGAAEGQQPPDEAAKPASQDQQPDIWANASPEQKAAYESLKANHDRLERDHRANAGRVSALQKRINKLSEEAKAPENVERKPLVDELETMKADYPELADPLAKIIGVIDSRFAEHDQREEGRRKAAENERQQAVAELTTLLSEEETALESAHPGWGELLEANKETFRPWLEDQPKRLRDAAYRNEHAIVNAAEAAEVIAAFKTHLDPGKTAAPAPAAATNGATTSSPPNPNPPLNDRRTRQLDATASPHRSGGRPTVSGIPKEGDPEEIWKAFDAEEAAQARA
ncbi:MAG: hypothetical protein K5872_22245 [Rhizobiaceae bacterium]|nr:hypothetical protein [Rhizobiaceae bacterium]MCV0408942.1 hypothetical protein [Rhizobiaceae bacterium]